MIHVFAKAYGWTPHDLEGLTVEELEYLSVLIKQDEQEQVALLRGLTRG